LKNVAASLKPEKTGQPEAPKLPLPCEGRGEKARELHKLIKEDLGAWITTQIGKNLAGHYCAAPGLGIRE
jgi:hypothetical protein